MGTEYIEPRGLGREQEVLPVGVAETERSWEFGKIEVSVVRKME